MASFTLERPQVFPEGTTVKAYAASNWPDPSSAAGGPKGASVAEGSISSGKVTFEGLAEDIPYFAVAEVGGSYRYIALMVASPKSSGVSPTNEIPASGAAVELATPKADEVIDLTLSANCTITLPAPVKGASFTLYRRQPATGGPYVITWVGTVKWPDKIPPELTEEAGAIDVISFQSPDAVAWYGFPVPNLG